MSCRIIGFVSLSSVRGLAVSVAASWARRARGSGVPLPRRSLVVMAAVGWFAALCSPVAAAPGGEVGRGAGSGVERPVGSVEAGRCVAGRVGRLGDPEEFNQLNASGASQRSILVGFVYMSDPEWFDPTRVRNHMDARQVRSLGDPEWYGPARGSSPTHSGRVQSLSDPEYFDLGSSSRNHSVAWSFWLSWLTWPR
jgi:hypothetical protein